MKKSTKSFLSGMLCLLFLLSCVSVPAYANGFMGDIQVELTEMNELTVQVKVNQYFEQRLAYLNDGTQTIDVINSGMLADEAKHKNLLITEGITLESSSVAINSVTCWDSMATVSATETASFLINGAAQQETIEHEITVYANSAGIIKLQSDAYSESVTGFDSCSYIPPEMLVAAEMQAAGVGGSSCITWVAYNEVGTEESASGKSKYGEWYQGYKPEPGAAYADWCAMFVSWCAYHANIPSNTITRDWDVTAHRTFFVNRSKYYTSFKPGVSGAYTPSAGDVIFMLNSAADPGHVGLVYSVSSEVIMIVDGNWHEGNERDRVHYRSLRLTDSSIVAFGKPSYSSTSHTKSSEWTYSSSAHWKTCANCGFGLYDRSTHTAGSTWYWDGTTHWKKCTICGYGPISRASHTTMWDSERQVHICTVCQFESLVAQP